MLIKHFSEEKLSDHKKLSKIEEDMLFLKEIDSQYDMSTMEVTTLIDKLIKWGRNIFAHIIYLKYTCSKMKLSSGNVFK